MPVDRRFAVVAFALAALLAGLAPAAADSLTAEQVLRVQFTVDNNFTPEPPDVLRLNFGLIQVLEAFGARNARLSDCTSELGLARTTSFGTFVGLLNLDPSNSWKTPESLWNFDNPGEADFGPILDGSIRGRVDFFLDTGEVDIPLPQVNLNFIKATGPSGGIVVTPNPQIQRVEVVPKHGDPDPGQAGETNTLTITGATPGSQVFFIGGLGCGPVVLPACDDAVVDIGNPRILGTATVDGTGTASLDVAIPPQAGGRTVIFQAVERQTCKATNSVSFEFP
jgi:hypothetical protein